MRVEEQQQKFDVSMVLLERAARNQAVMNAGNAAFDFHRDMKANLDKHVEQKLFTCEGENLKGLLSTASNDEKVRMAALTKTLFSREMGELEALKKELMLAMDVMTHLTSLAFYHEFMTEAGTCEWERFRRVVLEAYGEASKREGAGRPVPMAIVG